MNHGVTGADKEIPQEIICYRPQIISNDTNCGCCTFRRSFRVQNGPGEPEKIKYTKQEYSLIEQLLCCYFFNYYCNVLCESNLQK